MLFRRLLPAIIWALFTMVLMGLPGTYFPAVTTFWEWLSPDKIAHLFIFGIQLFLLLYAFEEQYLSGRYRLLYVLLLFVVTVLFASLTEILQVYVFIGRDGNIFDFIADIVGVVIGLLAYILYNYCIKKKVKY